MNNKWLAIWQPTPTRDNWSPIAQATIIEFGPDPANGPFGNENEIELAIEDKNGIGVSLIAMVRYDGLTEPDYLVVIGDQQQTALQEIEL